MAELSQWEVVTDEMGHPVVRSLLLVAHILRARRILGLQAAQGRPRVLAAAQGCLHWAQLHVVFRRSLLNLKVNQFISSDLNLVVNLIRPPPPE